ncbi:MAG: DUF4920 domain-containing protein [Saprospiraceae bacterium]
MFKRFFILMVAASFFAFGCGSDTQAGAESTEAHDHEGHDHGDATAAEGDGVHFGETIEEDGAEDLAAFLPKMATVDSIDAKLVGTVESVCQTKGCWMNLQTENGEEIFVQFKDYGFFMPKDIAGRKVVVDGYAYRQVTSVDELKHYAEDEGASAEEIAAITEPKEELKFMASGVKLVD